MPRASFSHSVPVSRPPELIWQALQLAETWSGIGPVDDVWDAAHNDDGTLRGFNWSAHVGPTKYKGSANVAVAVEPHHMKLNIESTELVGALIADVEDSEQQTLVVTLEVVSKGALAAMFFPIVAEAIGRGLPQQVENFAATLDGDGMDANGSAESNIRPA